MGRNLCSGAVPCELVAQRLGVLPADVPVMGQGVADKPAEKATHLFLTSLRTTPEALLQLVRDTQLHGDAHRYRGNGAGAMATLRTAALNLLRLAGFRSIRAGMQAEMHDITALLAMAMRKAQAEPYETLNQPWVGGVKLSPHGGRPWAR